MKTGFMVTATLMAALVTTVSCGNNNKQSQSEKTEQAVPAALSANNLLAHADSLANQEVTIEGICTHTCKHGATKIFPMGSDNTKTIRMEAGPLGSFDTKRINAIVIATGTLREQRVDETYLQDWEAKLKAQTEKSHGETAVGCGSEKKAHGEIASTPEARTADFRAKIAERKAVTGKDYLPSHYMEASSYEIAEQRCCIPQMEPDYPP